MSSTDKLTPKQEKFVDVYLDTLNASEAVRQAYNDTTPNTVGVIAHENLRKPKIINAIEERKQTLKERFEAESHNAMSVLLELLGNKATPSGVKARVAQDILDRAGYKPTDKIEMEGTIVQETRITQEIAKRARMICDE